MANRPKSVYLTARTMSALRPDDSLSGRLNSIVDRYLEAVERDRDRVRRKFLPPLWRSMAATFRSLPPSVPTSQQIAGLIEGQQERLVRETLRDLPGGELLVLLELLEREVSGRPPDTHS
jgi:hypothetical protein